MKKLHGFQLSQEQMKELGMYNLTWYIHLLGFFCCVFGDIARIVKKIVMYIPGKWERALEIWVITRIKLNEEKIVSYIQEYEKSQKKQTKKKKK